MPPLPELRTERLLLRAPRAADADALAAMSADPRVMRHFPKTLEREESDALLERIVKLAEGDTGLWAVEELDASSEPLPFLGFVGLKPIGFEPPFPDATPASLELAWRLAHAAQGRGFATEAARAAVRYAFDELAIPELLSFTVPANRPSWRVMEKLGMRRAPETFAHPALPPDHPLSEHVLYRLPRPRVAKRALASPGL